MEPGADKQRIDAVIDAVRREGFTPFLNPGVERKVFAVLGLIDTHKAPLVDKFESLPGVDRVQLISEPYKLSSRNCHPEGTVVEVGGVRIGGPEIVVIAG